MELTKEQIHKVENYLDSKGIEYIDIRPEILDHIILDIEAEMNQEANFDNAFLSVKKKKLSLQLEETSSFLFGVGYMAPKIIIQKAKKIYGKFYALFMLSYFLPFVFFTSLDFVIKNPTESSYFILFKGFIIVLMAIFVFLFFKKPSKPKTTFGFILNTLNLNALIGLLVILFLSNNLKELNGMTVGMYFAFVSSTFMYYHFYQKHLDVIKKYKIS
jgi:hypothetical protein